MTVTIAYSTDATAWGGRRGRVTSSDTRIDLELSMPKELGGDGGPGTNPEQMFAAGYAACFHSALKVVGRADKADLSDTQVAAHVSIGTLESGGFGLAVELDVTIPRVDYETAVALVEKAHEVCPYSNATRGNIDVILTVR